MGRRLAVITMLALLCSITQVHSRPGNKISDLSTKFRYALYIFNDENAEVIRQFLLVTDSEVYSGSPVKFYQGRYYRVYLLNDDEEGYGYLCDDVQMAPPQSLPANSPQVTPANTPVLFPGMSADSEINPFFFPPNDHNALSIPTCAYRSGVITGQKLSPEALSSLEKIIARLRSAESAGDPSNSIPQLEDDLAGEVVPITQEAASTALFFYLKKRQGINENRIFFTHNRESESNIMMVIRRSFRIAPESPCAAASGEEYDCLEISIPVGTFEFTSVEDLLSMNDEYSGCSIPWQQDVMEHGVPDDTEDTGSEPDMVNFSHVALLDCLQGVEHGWSPSNPIDHPMVEQILGTGITSVAVVLSDCFHSLAVKRIYMTAKNREDAMEVPRSARINLLLLSIYGVPVAPMRYEVIENKEKGHFAIYCIQSRYQPEQLADHFLESPDVPAEEKMALIDTIIHYMNLCDISNGYQLKADDGFKGYFRVAVDSNYPNYCLINGTWHLIDLLPLFWSVGDHFSSANQQILDMSQSEDYYSFIKSLCTNPVQLYVFFCGRMYRPHQRLSQSNYPDDQRMAHDWLGLYNHALRRIATLPQMIHEFDRLSWRQLSAFDGDNRDAFWELLMAQRNSDPSPEFLQGVVEMLRRNLELGRPFVLDDPIDQRLQLPAEYHDLIGEMGFVDPVEYLSMTEEQRADKELSDIFDITRKLASTPESLLPSAAASAPEETPNEGLLEYLRIQALMKMLSQNMAEDNNRRAANRRRILREQRASNPPPPPVIHTHLTALNNGEMADFLDLQFNAEYLPVDSDGNCMWNAIAKVLKRKGITINPQKLMQAVLPSPGEQEDHPTHQQNWGDTDFTTKILKYLAQLGINVGFVIIQPYGAEMVAVWYGLNNGQLTVLPLDNNPVEIQQAIQNPNNITLVNHQNGNDSDFQMNHWGGVVPLSSPTNTTPLIVEEMPPEEPVTVPVTTTPEMEEPSAKRIKLTPGNIKRLDQVPAISSPDKFEHQFRTSTGLSLLQASGLLPRVLPGKAQPLTRYRNLLLSLISDHLLLCNRDVEGCGFQLDGILSLLPENQNVINQDLQTGDITPFLHLLSAFLRWMNPQPAYQTQSGIGAIENPLTKITLLFPVIGNQGERVYVAWRLILAFSARGYLHIKRVFIRNMDIANEDLADRQHLYFITNVPLTPLANLAWPFHTPALARWWLVAPQVIAPWMLGTGLAKYVEPEYNKGTGPNPQDLLGQLSDDVSQLEITATSFGSPGKTAFPEIIIKPPTPEDREEHADDQDQDKNEQEEGQQGNDTNQGADRNRDYSRMSFHKTNDDMPTAFHDAPLLPALALLLSNTLPKSSGESTQNLYPYHWRRPISNALSLGSTLVPLLIFSKHRH